jgi:hypothetical protein
MKYIWLFLLCVIFIGGCSEPKKWVHATPPTNRSTVWHTEEIKGFTDKNVCVIGTVAKVYYRKTIVYTWTQITFADNDSVIINDVVNAPIGSQIEIDGRMNENEIIEIEADGFHYKIVKRPNFSQL